jgi:hypothetical protein
MKKSPFKLTYYFGLLLFLIPVFLIIFIIILSITYNRKDKSYEEPKKVVKTKIVTKIVYDTVSVKVPKQKLTPNINIESKKQDTNIIKDSL